MQNVNEAVSIEQCIKHHQAQRRRLIPLDGKRPISAWRSGHRQAWPSAILSYGVMCGGRLLVLDFDSVEVYQRFCMRFPELEHTYTVRTRRGFHVYLRVARPVRTRQLHGIDIKGEGSYVVGEGSQVDGHTYTHLSHTPRSAVKASVHDIAAIIAWSQKHVSPTGGVGIAPPNPPPTQPPAAEAKASAPVYLTLTPEQIEARYALLTHAREQASLTGGVGIAPPQPPPTAAQQRGGKKPVMQMPAAAAPLTSQQGRGQSSTGAAPRDADIIAAYHMLARSIGRNNALYRAASHARRSGLGVDDALALLLDTYINTAASGQHRTEKPMQRYSEGVATIKSAFKRAAPSSAAAVAAADETNSIPTELDEQLLSVSKSTIPGRLIRALALAGALGSALCTRELLQIAKKAGIARSSVMRILHDKIGTVNNKRLIPKNPERDKETSGQKSKRGKGRPQKTYRIPTLSALCDLLGVTGTAADPLRWADLRSDDRYRQALHRELIKRLQPEATPQWHADRLGVSARTIHNYNRALNVVCVPVYGYIGLHWGNIAQEIDFPVRADRRTSGVWLQNENGERFPAVAGIAYRQLAEKRILALCHRLPSRYQFTPEARALWRHLEDPTIRESYSGAYELPAHLLPPAVRVSLTERAEQHQRTQNIINHELKLLSGIKNRRAEVLYDAGIIRMTDLIAAGEERLLELKWYDEYVTPRVVRKWIAQAELYLGLRAMTEDEQHENRWRENKKRLHDFKRYLRRIEQYEHRISGFDDIPVWPESLMTTLKMYAHSPHLVLWDAVCDEALGALRTYQARVRQMLGLPHGHLKRYALGTRQGWTTQARVVARWIARFTAGHEASQQFRL